MRNKHQVIEEPCEKKFSRTVLEARQGDDTLTLASESGAKSSKAQGETDLWLKNGNALVLNRLNELRISLAENPPLYSQN
jgi:hypothetical protein